MRTPTRLAAVLLGLTVSCGLTLATFPAPIASAHRDGCHRWHSCPSDTGSYVCGDLGYFNECGGDPPPPVYIAPPYTAPPPEAALTLPAIVAQYCGQNGRIDVTFHWLPSVVSAVTEEWLDLSIFDNAFQWGTFLSAGPLRRSVYLDLPDQYTWRGLLPDTTHYWRVNSRTNYGWFPSPTYGGPTDTFTTGHCD